MLRRGLLLTAALYAACLASPALAQERPLTIGLMTDLSGGYADFFGEGSIVAARIAIEDAGGSVAGRKIKLLTADHQNKPDIGSALARRWVDNDGVDAILDVPTSSVALAVNEVVREKNKTFLASGPFTSALTGERCSPNTVHWTLDNWALAHSLASAEVAAGGKSWFFVTADYAFGHDLERTATEAIKARGGDVLGSVRHPLDAHDFSSFLLQAQASPARIIGLANAGSDTTSAIKQAAEFGLMQDGKKLAGLATVINNIHEIGLPQTAGLLAAGPFYWDLNDETRAWSRRFQALHPRHNMPNDMQAGVYGVLVHYFKALRAGADPANGRAVVDAMKAMPTQDALFGAGTVRPDGRAIHPIHLFEVKAPAASKGAWDYYKVTNVVPAEQAFRPLDEGGCALVQGKS